MSRPARCAEGDAFGQPLYQAGDADLVDHLGQLAGAAGPEQGDRTGETLDHRLRRLRMPPRRRHT